MSDKHDKWTIIAGFVALGVQRAGEGGDPIERTWTPPRHARRSDHVSHPHP
jgi:hypothetical protein